MNKKYNYDVRVVRLYNDIVNILTNKKIIPAESYNDVVKRILKQNEDMKQKLKNYNNGSELREVNK